VRRPLCHCFGALGYHARADAPLAFQSRSAVRLADMTEEPKVGIFGWGVVRISAKVGRKLAEHRPKKYRPPWLNRGRGFASGPSR